MSEHLTSPPRIKGLSRNKIIVATLIVIMVVLVLIIVANSNSASKLDNNEDNGFLSQATDGATSNIMSNNNRSTASVDAVLARVHELTLTTKDGMTFAFNETSESNVAYASNNPSRGIARNKTNTNSRDDAFTLPNNASPHVAMPNMPNMPNMPSAMNNTSINTTSFDMVPDIALHKQHAPDNSAFSHISSGSTNAVANFAMVAGKNGNNGNVISSDMPPIVANGYQLKTLNAAIVKTAKSLIFTIDSDSSRSNGNNNDINIDASSNRRTNNGNTFSATAPNVPNVPNQPNDSKTINNSHVASVNNDDTKTNQFLKRASEFQNDYVPSIRHMAISPYELKAGSIIPATMISGINSDLAGMVVAFVRENVYDSVQRKYLLIPQGAKLVGVYDNNIIYGQERLLVAWNRLIYPDGSSVNLKAMPGSDIGGFAGLHDLVDNKYRKIFGMSFIVGVLTGAMQYSQNNTNANVQTGAGGVITNEAPTVGQTVAGSLGQQLGQTGLAIANKNINVAPTLTIRPNYPFSIILTADLILSPYFNQH